MMINSLFRKFELSSLYSGISNSIQNFLASQIDREADVAKLNPKFQQIAEFLERVGLEPTPNAYKLAWEYYYGTSSQLRTAIDDLVVQNGQLPHSSVKELSKTHLNFWDDEDISKLIGAGKLALHNGYKIICHNRGENRQFGRALEQQIEETNDLVDINHPFRELIDLTQAMVHKSLEAERQLKEAEDDLSYMREKLADVRQKAETDQLTGLPNRWAFEDCLKDAMLRSREAIEPLSVAFIDVDNFKLINDSHGHATGDRVLKRIARHLNDTFDEQCHVARHGGEEFVVLLRDRSSQEAFELVDEARAQFANKELTNRETNTKIGSVSFSAGIASLSGDGDARAMLRNADAVLYVAKERGRNQVVVHTPESVI